MELYLLRHANADTQAASDDARPLSEAGIRQAKKVGRFCKKHGIEPNLLLTSPLVRARETAEHFAEALSGIEPKVVEFLASGMTPQTALTALQAYQNYERVLIVGHEPDFSALFAHLLGLKSNAHVPLKKASLTGLEVPVLRAGTAQLRFSITCALMS